MRKQIFLSLTALLVLAALFAYREASRPWRISIVLDHAQHLEAGDVVYSRGAAIGHIHHLEVEGRRVHVEIEIDRTTYHDPIPADALFIPSRDPRNPEHHSLLLLVRAPPHSAP
jgi:ABC-type transporter Mla subunit MlaD